MIKHKINIALISSCLLTGLSAQQVRMESVSDSVVLFRMNEIVIEANRIPALRAVSIHTIEKDEIKLLDSRNVVESMNFAPGVHLFNYGSNGESSFMIRGYEQRNVSVFLDGIPVAMPFDGKLDMAQFVGDDLENIRIARGNSSTLFGANAQGGSVNILSADMQKGLKLKARAEGSTDGAFFASAAFKNNAGKLYYGINFNWDASSDYPLSASFQPTLTQANDKRNNSAYNKKSLGLKLQYQIDESHQLGLNLNHVDNWFHVPVRSKSTDIRYWRFPEWNSTMVSLKSRHVFSGKFMLNTVFFYNRYGNILHSFTDNSFTDLRWESEYDDHAYGALLYPTFSFLKTGNTNVMLSFQKDIHRQNFEKQRFQKYSMATWTVAIDQDFKLGRKWSLAAGLNLNYLNPLEADTNKVRNAVALFNAQLTANYKVSNRVSWFASLGKKSRFPTMKELYSEYLDKKIPNPDLREENAINTEFGFRFNERIGYFQAALFYNRINDMITTVYLDNSTEQLQNIGKAILSGLEMDLLFKWQDSHTLINYTYLIAENQSDNRTSNQLAIRPRHRISFIERWVYKKKLQLAFESTVVLKRYYQDPDFPSHWGQLNNYAVLNFKLAYDLIRYLNAYLRLNNFLDEDYESDYGYPMPGRSILMGLRFNL